jgi:hypothetical protein
MAPMPGHINFRRSSEMHGFVKGMPQFKTPTELNGCPLCLAAKLCKAPKGTETAMQWLNTIITKYWLRTVLVLKMRLFEVVEVEI